MRSETVSGPRHPELTPILDTVLDAVVIIALDGVVVGWNAVAERTFGWTMEQAVGRSLAELIVPPAHREAHNRGMARLLGGGQPRVLNRRIEITALTAAGDEIPVELSITTAQTADGPLFVGFLRDISSTKAAEEALRRQAGEARLMFDVAHMAAEAESFEAALEQVLAAICRLSDWSVGHAFLVPDGEPPRLVSTSIWYEDEPGAADALRAATEAITFEAGVGLPGRILAEGAPLWVADTDLTGNFLRSSAGFRGAFGFPLIAAGRVTAILEFFARSPMPPDEERLLTVRTLGEQVGRVLERRRRDDRERLLALELNHRVKNLLMVIQVIARQTFRESVSHEEGLKAFSGRLKALAHAQDVLLTTDRTEVRLRDLLTAAVAGSGNTLDPFDVSGDDLKITAARALPVGLALHELCTNSVKYGALSAPTGRVKVTWKMNEERTVVDFEWRETGGPPVAPPARRGFGSTLLGSNLDRELGGEMSLDYRREGLVFRVQAPLSDINRRS